MWTSRSRRPEVLCKKVFLKNFEKFKENTCARVYFTSLRSFFIEHLCWWYLLKRGTTWNDLKWQTTSKKRPETTYNEQETTWRTTWNELQRAWNDLKRQYIYMSNIRLILYYYFDFLCNTWLFNVICRIYINFSETSRLLY